ncbi:MAG TPA: VCBS repeat-containing protein, partial [Terriglobia bacterium]
MRLTVQAGVLLGILWAGVLNQAPAGSVTFTDVTAAAGITFLHDNAATPEKYLIETMGAGCAWIDYDQDGLLDIYLVNSAGTAVYKPQKPLRSALYRNRGDGTFEDVTASAGVAAEGLFGMGVAVGDYDNDGFPDLMVLGYSRSILYHNNGDGTFADATAKAGVANRGHWASSGAWFDYDKDGHLDLVIANYVDWTPQTNHYCGDQGPGMRSYCHPDVYHGQPPTLYRNNGDGTFTDVSRAA